MHINCLPIAFALMVSYQTAKFVRAFSCQNSIKTSRRNKLKEKCLNMLMTIKISKCSVAEIDYELDINMWKEKKACRIYKNESYQ